MNRFQDMLTKGKALMEAAEKKPAAKAKAAPKILSQNPGNGYHGVVHTLTGDVNKAHAEYNKMHAKVKDLAGEAGHLTNSKKPNIMVRDYLDSARGRHLEGLQADDKYIKKDFGAFSKSYDPKLFEETLNEGKLVNVHVNWTGDYGSQSHFHKQFPSMKHAKKYTSDFEKKENYRPVWTYEPTNNIRESRDDVTGTYSHQTRNGQYKNIRIAKHFSGTYHIHHADGSKTTTDEAGAKGYIKRNNAMWLKEGFDTGPDRSAAGVLNTILEAKRNAKPHPDSLIDYEIDDEGFATRK